MKFKEGDTVYLKGKVVECIKSDFEIGFGYHSEEYLVKLNEVNGTFVFKNSLLLSKEEIKNEKLIPVVGKRYKFKGSTEIQTFTVKHITDRSVFYEYDKGHGYVLNPCRFDELCLECEE